MQLTTILPLALAALSSAMPEPTPAPAAAQVERVMRRQQTSGTATGTSVNVTSVTSLLNACATSLSALQSNFPSIPTALNPYVGLVFQDSNCSFTMAESVSSDFVKLSSDVSVWASTSWSSVQAATSTCSPVLSTLGFNLDNLNCSPSIAVVWTGGNQTRTENFRMIGVTEATATPTPTNTNGGNGNGGSNGATNSAGQTTATPSPTGNAAALARPELGVSVVLGAIAGFMIFQ
ncbi:hypothetical protein PpBr36_05030 [Pyricularia pennisetigena]|uniref:hypothetical protein n=1 Tax=Pyricularia pennisetigena TaxID=1578925 RepID=UPI0011529FB1|nr:hypothetical protein PpBr36_05030 [Pyricularia pennisetigena]TLS26820.1 hypothetical protein PpBr36_05030 [Pyricularia pennisetigena]